MNAKTLTALAALVLFSATVPARSEHMTVVPAEDANKHAYVTNKGIQWYTSLEDAQAEARREGKLVFWLHMLGTIDGET